MRIIYEGKLRRLGLTIAHGDIFDAPVEAIVNSEETGFRLAHNPHSISGQIRLRYGNVVQPELNDLTRGEILRAGTVLVTSGGPDFRFIFHAGFHDPADWPGFPGCSDEADYFHAIGGCIACTLQAANLHKVSTVAFPLLGCGTFGLSIRLLLQQFLDAIDQFDLTLNQERDMRVWLVVRDDEQSEDVVRRLIEFTLSDRCRTTSVSLPTTHVAPLDRFAVLLRQRHPEDWNKWQLCRYAEVALEIMYYGLVRASQISDPQHAIPDGQPATFGLIHERAKQAAVSRSLNMDAWGARFFSAVLSREDCSRALGIVRSERNNLAHGRRGIPLSELEGLCKRGLQLSDWSRIPEMDGPFTSAAWIPWIVQHVGRSREAVVEGLLERCQRTTLRYIVPETGEIFTTPRFGTV